MATVLEGAGVDPTVVNGGIINAWGTNARLGKGDWFVVEADESDGTFLKFPNEIAVITNIDPEHLDHWATFEAIKQGFHDFVMNLPFYGFAVMCIDHPTVRETAAAITDRTIVTYGESDDADVRLVDFSHDSGGTRFSVVFSASVTGAAERIDDVRLPMPGKHNALNAVSAITVARRIGVPAEAIVTALAGFEGVKRRFTLTGEWNGVRIYDDYGHHPVEISAVLHAARGAVEDSTGSGRVIAIMQPHRYSRLSSLFEGSPAASARPTRSSSPMSTPPARTRFRAPTVTLWSKASRPAVTRTRGRCRVPRHWHRRSRASPGRATW
jgi:UDP-N-acetylmuramate--alanine ligase